jgi:hypothetical protein
MFGGNLPVVVLGPPHNFDISDRVHENLAQQKNVETIYTELDAYIHTYIMEKIYSTYLHTYIMQKIYYTYIHTYSAK